MDNDAFLFYSDYMALTAEAGLQNAVSLFKAIDPINRVNPRTFEIFGDGITARNSLLVNLRSSYEESFTDNVSVLPMEGAFRALADHILEFTAGTIDQYLTDQSLQVDSTYAKISRLFGQSISTENIEV